MQQSSHWKRACSEPLWKTPNRIPERADIDHKTEADNESRDYSAIFTKSPLSATPAMIAPAWHSNSVALDITSFL
jgi:hypothetical protein